MALGDTQQQFAQRVGLSITTVARYETNATPIEDVLITFAKIARESDLPFFAEIFEKRVPAQEPLDFQELAAVKELLKSRAENLQPDRLRNARLALALLNCLPQQLDSIEAQIGPSQVEANDYGIDHVAGEMSRNRDSEAKARYISNLQHRVNDKVSTEQRADLVARKDNELRMLGADAIEDRITKIVLAKLQEFIRPQTPWPELMSLETAAEYIDRLKKDGTGSVEAIRLLIRKKLIPTTKIDDRVQVRKADIDKLIERKTG